MKMDSTDGVGCGAGLANVRVDGEERHGQQERGKLKTLKSDQIAGTWRSESILDRKAKCSWEVDESILESE